MDTRNIGGSRNERDIGHNSSERRGGDRALSDNRNQVRRDSRSGMSFVLRKAEKLTTALYMVSDVMSDKEPMKWRLREGGVDLLSGIGRAVSGPSSDRIATLTAVLDSIERLIAFLDIAEASRMLSAMNASVLKKEYALLKSSVEYEWNKLFDGGMNELSESFFEVPHEAERPPERSIAADVRRPEAKREALPPERTPRVPEVTEPIPKREERSAPVVAKKSESEARHEPIKIHPERMHAATIHPPKETREERSVDELRDLRRPDTGDKGARQKAILALVTPGSALGIKEFSKNFPSVSEKTIQRELLALVSEGLLIKKGERRWSTYSLPS